MIEVHGEAEMRHFGEKIGQQVTGGTVIELVGDVGAGKTTFVRGLAEGMGVTETVASPSFTINRVYDAADGRRLMHYDFYRLHDPGIMTAELSETLSDPSAVIVIEWAESIRNVLTEDRLTMVITSPTESSRHISLKAGGEKSKQLLENLQ